jgi:hypothetical protein
MKTETDHVTVMMCFVPFVAVQTPVCLSVLAPICKPRLVLEVSKFDMTTVRQSECFGALLQIATNSHEQ